MSLPFGGVRTTLCAPTVTVTFPSWWVVTVPTASSSETTLCHSMLWPAGCRKSWRSVSRLWLLRCSGGDVISASLVVARRREAGSLALDLELALVVLAADLGPGLLVFLTLGDVKLRRLVGRRWHLVRVEVVEPGLDPLLLG